MTSKKILLIDVSPNVPYRVCKDVHGGYGAGNDFGDGLLPGIIEAPSQAFD